jgi:hypothetical protein
VGEQRERGVDPLAHVDRCGRHAAVHVRVPLHGAHEIADAAGRPLDRRERRVGGERGLAPRRGRRTGRGREGAQHRVEVGPVEPRLGERRRERPGVGRARRLEPVADVLLAVGAVERVVAHPPGERGGARAQRVGRAQARGAGRAVGVGQRGRERGRAPAGVAHAPARLRGAPLRGGRRVVELVREPRRQPA